MQFQSSEMTWHKQAHHGHPRQSQTGKKVDHYMVILSQEQAEEIKKCISPANCQLTKQMWSNSMGTYQLVTPWTTCQMKVLIQGLWVMPYQSFKTCIYLLNLLSNTCLLIFCLAWVSWLTQAYCYDFISWLPYLDRPHFSYSNPWRHTDIIMTSSPLMTSFLHHYDIILTYNLISLHCDIIARTV